MTSNQAAEMRLAQQEDAKLLARQQAGNPEASLLESLDTLLRAVNPLEKMDRTAENFLRTARAGAKQRLQKAEQAEEMLYQAQEALKNRDMDTYLRLSEEANAAMAMDRAFADWLLLKLIPEYDPGEENPLRNQAESARRKWAQEEHGFLGDATYAAADMGSTALTAGVTGLPFLGLIAAESGADKATQVLDETGDAQKALEMGIGSGAVSAGVESMFGIAGKWGSPLLKKMAGSAAGQKLLGLLPNRTLAWLEKLSRKKLAQVLGNAAGEGIESLAEDELQRVFENLMLDRDTPRDIREELYRALVSFAVGGVFDVGRTALDTIGGKTVNDGMKSPQESGIIKKQEKSISKDSFGELNERLNWDAVISKKGETRTKHIDRHSVPDINRETHGVFNGNSVEMINRAWEQRHLVDPISDGMGGLIYNIPYYNAGYESGYMNKGARMDYITIITLEGSTDLVTAFPSFGDYHK